ncbi:type II toxin-antitoxin system VapC family toxin [Candidatus Bathyarchaeota archaeon]|nr:type II toxin-antitoxin system VapC family toxin [Candidatus Bathyarchaeota archaeon]
MEKEKIKSIFDASAIYPLFKRLKASVYDVIRDIGVLDLTKYEVGNAIWVEAVRGLVSNWSSVSKAWANIFKILVELEIEDVADVEEMALKLNLTFYDASYIYVAYKKNLTLVTEDDEMRRKAVEIGVKAISVDEFVSSMSI